MSNEGMALATAMEKCRRIRSELDRVLVGQDDVKDRLLACFISGGHALIQGVPGTGKTLLAMALSRLSQCSFDRIQFTPEVSPAELLGRSVYSEELQDYQFHAGPIFTDIFMGDEINRTPPQTQAALLEAMQERAVSIGGEQRALSKIFFVMATQNPLEYEATYPLPEAQCDRFQMQIDINFSRKEEERAIIDAYADGSRLHEQVLATLEPVMSLSEIHDVRRLVKTEIAISDQLRDVIAQVVETTREDGEVRMGASTRGSIAMLDSARAFALLRGREHVDAKDLADTIVPTLVHRVVMVGDAGPRPFLRRIARSVANNEPFHCRQRE